MIELEFKDSVTSQQRAWWNEALSRMSFLKDAATVSFKATVETVDDPPCPGHTEYMCTGIYYSTDAPKISWYIRTGADDPTQDMNAGVADDVKSFFMESVVHEYAHVIIGLWLAPDDGARSDLCHMFTKKGSGKVGTLGDWNPDSGVWEDMIKEAAAEFFKDVFMPSKYRYYSQRTNWSFNKFYFNAWIDMVYAFLCPADPTET